MSADYFHILTTSNKCFERNIKKKMIMHLLIVLLAYKNRNVQGNAKINK